VITNTALVKVLSQAASNTIEILRSKKHKSTPTTCPLESKFYKRLNLNRNNYE
tara:strand:- start:256 stop:414 length:159 start_codon:yes stop_codon:yes gene_type:complete